MRPDAGGADRALEDAGDLGERELLEAREEEDLAVVAVEAAEGAVKEGMVVPARRGLVGAARLVGVGLQVGGVDADGRRGGLPEMVAGAAAGQVVHPGREAALVPVGVAVLEHPLEHGLGDVLGRGPVAGQLGQVAEEGAVVALEELAHAVQVAVADGEHELMVGKGGVGFHGRGSAPVKSRWSGMHRDFGGGWTSSVREGHGAVVAL